MLPVLLFFALALMLQLLKLCIIIIGFVVATQGSRGPLSPPASAPTPQKSKETEPFISPSSSSIALSPQYEVVPSPTTLQGIMPPSAAPAAQKARQLHHAPHPLTSFHSPALAPSISNYKHHHIRNIITIPAPASSYTVSPPISKPRDRAIPPSLSPTSGRKRHHVPPKVSPPGSSSKTLPHPPPNEDCLSTVCTEPYVTSPPGTPCRCVWPIRVGLRLSVSLYTFFPLVSELASELASGIFMKQSQITIVGANAANQQPDKTVVLINLVPLGEKFDNSTAFLTSHRFWHKKVVLKASYFGDYDVLYLNYPGLPPSPPLPPSSITMIDGGPYTIDGNNGRTIKPIGVDIQKRQNRGDLSREFIAIIAISVFVAVVLCTAAAWFMFKFKVPVSHPALTPWLSHPSLTKAPVTDTGSLVGDGRVGSVSSSFETGMTAYKVSVKTFSMNDIEKATDNFDSSRILGEGGFGLVYGGVLENGTKVAVKVLKKREDLHSNHEFLSEVEMLSRLHHRNLVKLIGICTEEDSFHCLVYELVTNGSLESQLHGVDREKCALDWRARMKIALGAARGLAYLHEDSSPCVIHRDFKSSNILLEDDFTPKVSDFGLARTAVDEESRHISTRVVGTFGYVAPEYAMNGHLHVKSDVYSYGVVLLELLTGRKPIDMSQTPGQENLVAWSHQFLTSKEGLEAIIDPSIGLDAPSGSVAKVAAIASMCVQPEASNRPFMSEVVQALKLVCNECEEAKEDDGLRSYSQEHEDLSVVDNDIENGLSASELFSSCGGIGRMEYETYRRKSYSGPMGNGRSKQLWEIMRRLSGGSVSEHGTI
ncbi:receptor-like serine/threonine-protein kinase ALE2 [Vicia villosa]|uniref:receptor-like serine/threonine-protein kinase ALE2 n=1 Tax=Vicia villosa TaxID=3911 RepID=UPI00273BEEE9|nr:receptor-like serine/threonine-protein kinase ALE2 [Vicia villosa]